MTQSTEQEIIKRLEKISENISEIKTDVAVIKANQQNMKEQLSMQQNAINKIPDLAEKVGELKNWRQIAIIIIAGTISSVFTWFLKGGRY